MPTSPRKRLQVFVSSTYLDLKEERQAAVSAILTTRHIPAGMELFTSGDESQLNVIKQWIDESDVYMLILGGRYGSIEPTTGKSYTHLEYEYAIEKEKPFFACIANDDAIEAKIKEHGSKYMETENADKLRNFRKLVASKTCKFWDDPKDIKIITSESLSQIAYREDLIGWVRADQEGNTPASVTDELVRLSEENARLRGDLANLMEQKSDSEMYFGLTFQEIKQRLDNLAIVEPILVHRHEIGDIFDRNVLTDDIEAFNELIAIGIVESISPGAATQYTLTESGRAFVNRLHYFIMEKDHENT